MKTAHLVAKARSPGWHSTFVNPVRWMTGQWESMTVPPPFLAHFEELPDLAGSTKSNGAPTPEMHTVLKLMVTTRYSTATSRGPISTNVLLIVSERCPTMKTQCA